MHVALGWNGLHRGRERLAEHLTAEDRAPAEILALPAEEILLDALEREQLDELLEDAEPGLRHSSPRLWRSFMARSRS